jgi:hypothetical protein
MRTNNPTSGSIATIVRIPYIYQLAQTSDFLYANTDVAIWSTVEPGLGITAAAMACLRPLVQTFLSSSSLLGSSKPTTAPATTWRRAGYLRSRDDEEMGTLRTVGGRDADWGSVAGKDAAGLGT